MILDPNYLGGPSRASEPPYPFCWTDEERAAIWARIQQSERDHPAPSFPFVAQHTLTCPGTVTFEGGDPIDVTFYFD